MDGSMRGAEHIGVHLDAEKTWAEDPKLDGEAKLDPFHSDQESNDRNRCVLAHCPRVVLLRGAFHC